MLQKKKKAMMKINEPGIGGKLKELPFGGEDNQSNFGIAKHRDLMSFLEQPSPALGERHLPADLVLDSLKLNPTSPHFRVTFFFHLENPEKTAKRKKTKRKKIPRKTLKRVHLKEMKKKHEDSTKKVC